MQGVALERILWHQLLWGERTDVCVCVCVWGGGGGLFVGVLYLSVCGGGGPCKI